MTEDRSNLVPGRNAVLAALKAGQEIDAVYVAAGTARPGAGGERAGSLVRILSLCRERRIPVKEVAPVKLDHMVDVPHQGVIASCSSIAYAELEDLFRLAESRGEPPFIVISDELEDPHNLGAILRTAECAGAHGLILPKRRGAQMTPAAVKAAAGAASRMPVVRADNLVSTIETLKKRGVWVYGADMDGQPYGSCDLTGPAALVIGSEGNGLGRLVAEKCDGLLSLPMYGEVGSLNASVAAGILMYEIMRQRRQKQ